MELFVLVGISHFLALLLPGADFLLIVRLASRAGWRACLPLCSGIALGNGVYIVLAFSGLQVLQHTPWLLQLIQGLGAAYLLYLSVLLLTPNAATTLSSASQTESAAVPARRALMGLLSALLGGALVSFVLAAFSIKYLVDQIIVGVVLNALAIGITNFFYAAVLNENSQETNFPGTLPFLPIPLLSDIPVLGDVFFNHRITTYLMFILVPLVWFILFKTRWGLRLRAVGEHPLAADTVGINVNRTRFWSVIIAGMIAGLGGAALTIGSVGAFVREMSAGQGFIALACVILGRWNPWLAALAALLFGFSKNFRIFAGQTGSSIPPDLIAMVPYLVTLIAVAGLVGRVVGPAAAGKPYVKQ